MKNKVSIILPTYNRAYIISKAIQSVINQTYANWELIIVDDGSTDDTENKILQFNDDRIKYIHYEKNHGSNYARNLGMENANGEYIAFIDSDNEWNIDYLKKQLFCFENSDEDIDVVFAKSFIIQDNSQVVFPTESSDELDTHQKMIEKSCVLSIFETNVICMKKKIYTDGFKFNENLKRLQDWDYFFDILLNGAYTFKFNDEVLNYNYIQSDSKTNTDSLFWDARLYIFEKHIDVYRKYNSIPMVLEFILESKFADYISPKQAEKLFSLITKEEKADLCKRHYYIKCEWIKNYNHLMEFIKVTEHQDKLLKKKSVIMDLQKKWIECLIGGKSTQQYFNKHNIRSICIYGFGMLGKLLWNELKKSDIQVKQIIDANIQSDEVDIYKLEDVCDFECDAIVVTAVAAFEEISQNIKEKTNIEIISIKDVIENL